MRGGPQGAPSFTLDPRRIEEGLQRLGAELAHWANQGRHTRVRVKFRGRPLLPDLPLAAFLAAEGLALHWAGILRALLLNVGGAQLLEVELVHDADRKVQEGKDALLSGELDEALERFHEALAMNRDSATAHLHLGIAHKLKGERTRALAALERARALDPDGPVGAEAQRLLSGLQRAPAP